MKQPSKSTQRKDQIVAAATAHLIEHGFGKSSLRAIAASAGMSDRMVMYYFETKDDLVAAALVTIGEAVVRGMDDAIPRHNMSARALHNALSETMAAAEYRDVMRLWFEIVGLAVGGQQPYQTTAIELLQRSEDSIRAKLRSDQKHRAREILERLEGQIMIGLLAR